MSLWEKKMFTQIPEKRFFGGQNLNSKLGEVHDFMLGVCFAGEQD